MSMMQNVMEAYAGRTKELIQCEGYLRQIITMINKDHEGKLTSKRTVTRDAEPCKKLEQTLAKFFDIKELSIYWNNGEINAYSLPGSSLIIAVRDSNGDFTKARFHIAVYENLVYDAGLNERELMAVILHEIGHCFYCSPMLVTGELLGYLLNPLNVILPFIGKGLYKLMDEGDAFIKKRLPFAYNLMDKYDQFMIEINRLFSYLTPIPNIIGIAKRGANNLMNPLTTFGRYGGERGADSFAAKYGYGGDQVSALKKMERPANLKTVRVVNSLGGFGDFMDDYNKILIELCGMLSLDPHPSTDLRAQAMIRKMERDLQNGDYPPEVKKDLQKEIARTKEIYKTLDDNKSNVEIKKAWHNMLNIVTNGHGDIREIFNKFYENDEF